jgi:hypothetical protein
MVVMKSHKPPFRKFNKVVYGMGLRCMLTGEGDEVIVYRAGSMDDFVCVLPRSACVADDLTEVEETIRLHMCFGD